MTCGVPLIRTGELLNNGGLRHSLLLALCQCVAPLAIVLAPGPVRVAGCLAEFPSSYARPKPAHPQRPERIHFHGPENDIFPRSPTLMPATMQGHGLSGLTMELARPLEDVLHRGGLIPQLAPQQIAKVKSAKSMSGATQPCGGNHPGPQFSLAPSLTLATASYRYGDLIRVPVRRPYSV